MNMPKIEKNVVIGKAEKVKELAQSALDAGIAPNRILNEGLISGMKIVGGRFSTRKLHIPDVLLAAKAMRAGMDVLRPALISSGIGPVGKVAIGAVKGDLHDLGKNLVAMMLEGAGFDVIDLGVDVPPARFVEAAEDGADIIAMSALLTTSMVPMKDTITALKKAGLRDRARIMVGGALVNQEYADRIGADAYAEDATSAANQAIELMEAL